MLGKRLFILGFGTIFLLVVLNACSQKMENVMTNTIAWEKMDASLRSELRAGLEANSDTTFVVFAEMTDNNDEFASELIAIDVEVQSRAGVIWTLRGNAQSFANASSKVFVKRMELSQRRRTS